MSNSQMHQLKTHSEAVTNYSEERAVMEEAHLQLKYNLNSTIEDLNDSVNSLGQLNMKIFELCRTFKSTEMNKNDLGNTLHSLKSEMQQLKDKTPECKQKSFEHDRRLLNIESENHILQKAVHKNQLQNIESKSTIKSLESLLNNKYELINELNKRNLSMVQTLDKVKHQIDKVKHQMKYKDVKNISTLILKIEDDTVLNKNLELKSKQAGEEKFRIQRKTLEWEVKYEALTILMENPSDILVKPNIVLNLVRDHWRKNIKCCSMNFDNNKKNLEQLTRSFRQIKMENKELIILLKHFEKGNETIRRKLLKYE